MTSYRIAIPSYNRVDELGMKTLKLLEKHGFEKDIIDIFVANQEEYDKYKEKYKEYNIVIGEKGIREIREFVLLNYYKENQAIVFIDDDIEHIYKKDPSQQNKFLDLQVDLKKEIDLAFTECKERKLSLWGIYPLKNPFFMKNNITYDYKFIIGHFFGCVIKRDLCKLSENIGGKDDYERSILHYMKEGGMVRLNYLCAKTKYLAPGGIGVVRDQSENAKLLMDKYPGLMSLRMKKTGPNPILRDMRKVNGS
tara:strand:- start:278 stop:1033 length:756 start_codon:yes stop_codon:yes gene_type:complete